MISTYTITKVSYSVPLNRSTSRHIFYSLPRLTLLALKQMLLLRWTRIFRRLFDVGKYRLINDLISPIPDRSDLCFFSSMTRIDFMEFHECVSKGSSSFHYIYIISTSGVFIHCFLEMKL